MLTRTRYTVALYTDGPGSDVTEHDVEVSPGDQFRAELEGQKRGLIPGGISQNPLVFGTLSVYYACVRSGVYGGKFDTFTHTDCYEFDAVKDDAGEVVKTDVDPTLPGDPSPSDSYSPTATETPATG